MKVLLTGGSSFSGLWLARKLKEAGHKVVAPVRSARKQYEGVRGARVAALSEVAEVVENVTFGDERFLDLVKQSEFDVLGLHAAQVNNYRSIDFDFVAAVSENTRNLRQIMETAAGKGLKAVIATGSVFEYDSGAGNHPMEAFSPYGLSKGLSYEAIRFWTRRAGITLGKFVIANPFGPFEEPRLGNFLMTTWKSGSTATINTPEYLRDNIHVDLLALSYRSFAEQLLRTRVDEVYGPIGYQETVGAFVQRFSDAMSGRLGMECKVELKKQTDFSEPITRVNTHQLNTEKLGWSEERAWDDLAEYYRGHYGLSR